LLESNASLEKYWILVYPLFLTKHITVFYNSFLSIEKTVICFVKNSGYTNIQYFSKLALLSSNAAFHSRLALARSPGASRDMNQEIYLNI
jgi:hypothetical protein